MSQTTASSHSSPWSPLRLRTFRYLWLATLVSNIGSWMHDVGAGWLMVTLTTSPIMVALVQTATSLPAFFILLPSGALSDILDRRLYLMSGNIVMGLTALGLGLLTVTGHVDEWSLLGLTFLLGIGFAMIMPAWQAIIPEVVPRAELGGAIALNTMGMNVSRVIGSLIAGVIIAASGSGAVFLCNAATFIFIITVLAKWKRAPLDTKLPPEGFFPAIKTGLRYARHSPALQATIFRGVGFFFFASVMWALLPLIAKELLHGGPQTYSALFAAISVGAIASALLMPKVRARFSNDQLITYASIIFAIAMIITATVHVLALALLSLSVCGAAWITVMTGSQVSAQTALPNWVRSRGISVFLTFFMGSLAIGPFVWGNIAKFTDLPTAMITASVCLIIAALFTRRWPLSGNDKLDHTPSGHWKTPTPLIPVSPEQGPVMISIRYQVNSSHVPEFLTLMQQLGKARKRDGAFEWQLMQDTSGHDSYLEFFMVYTWLDHLRQHERISTQDAQLQHQIKLLLLTDTIPVITHFVKPSLHRKKT
ncbi:MAG: MFS transporter [Pseudomonadales bacterium]|nr:MFS transporter [Pseudomonadales bacterium]